MGPSLHGRRIVLIIGGGIAAYKTLELIRLLREHGAQITSVLTNAGSQFVTPTSLSALTGERTHSALFNPGDGNSMEHIELSRAADLIVVAPATADIMAKMAHGHADDLATALLLARNKDVLIAPAMNVRMWKNPATQRNLASLQQDGVLIIGPNEGDMACGEFGFGRMAEPAEISGAILAKLANGALSGKHIIVTSGPTHEPIDPVRYIANRSSGTQGSAIAQALANLGANITFITGPATAAHPKNCTIVEIKTAREMLGAVQGALPADVAIFAAAVADWTISNPMDSKIKKGPSSPPPTLEFTENPDILASVAHMETGRPALVIGFAAETENLVKFGQAKRLKKGCDWILANDVSPGSNIMGGQENAVTFIDGTGVEDWPRMHKKHLANRLADRIVQFLNQ